MSEEEPIGPDTRPRRPSIGLLAALGGMAALGADMMPASNDFRPGPAFAPKIQQHGEPMPAGEGHRRDKKRAKRKGRRA